MYSMTIEPAIQIDDRHEIERCLERLGYEVVGAGMMLDESSCDIQFDDKEKK